MSIVDAHQLAGQVGLNPVVLAAIAGGAVLLVPLLLWLLRGDGETGAEAWRGKER